MQVLAGLTLQTVRIHVYGHLKTLHSIVLKRDPHRCGMCDILKGNYSG